MDGLVIAATVLVGAACAYLGLMLEARSRERGRSVLLLRLGWLVGVAALTVAVATVPYGFESARAASGPGTRFGLPPALIRDLFAWCVVLALTSSLLATLVVGLKGAVAKVPFLVASWAWGAALTLAASNLVF